MAASTVGAVLARLGLNRLSRLEPPEPPNRYWRRHPGELVHIDIKKLGRFRRPGHRVTGRARHGVTLTGRRLGLRARRRRRLHPPRLRRRSSPTNAAPPASGSSTRHRLVRRPQASTCSAVMTDNGAGYRAQVFAAPVRRAATSGTSAPALPAPHQRQSRTVHPDACYANGPTPPRYQTSHHRARALPRLARLLQPPTTPQRPRPPTTRHAAIRRLTNVPGIYS